MEDPGKTGIWSNMLNPGKTGVGVPAVPPCQMSPRTCGPRVRCPPQGQMSPPRTPHPRIRCPPLGLLILGSDVPLRVRCLPSETSH